MDNKLFQKENETLEEYIKRLEKYYYNHLPPNGYIYDKKTNEIYPEDQILWRWKNDFKCMWIGYGTGIGLGIIYIIVLYLGIKLFPLLVSYL